MRFGRISRLILFGGSHLMVRLVQTLKDMEYEVVAYSAKRQLEEVVGPNSTTLRDMLKEARVVYHECVDINTDDHLRQIIDVQTLGLGIGEGWTFSRDIIKQFDGRLLDFMGIRLPQYRGGAHYTWQILRRNRVGSCNLQVINDEMVPAVFDSGEIVKTLEYLHPAWVRTPQDYFDSAVKQETAFILEFLDEVRQGKEFRLTPLQENFSLYFPRLYTPRHGFINWAWDTREIEDFVCAFDDPYAGASTFMGKTRVFLKKCLVDYSDGPFHPFQSGLVYRTDPGRCFIASRQGTLVIQSIRDQDGRDLLGRIRVGTRFFTPARVLEEAIACHAEYDSDGVKTR